jgi:polysaccharide export outer membrane protein
LNTLALLIIMFSASAGASQAARGQSAGVSPSGAATQPGGRGSASVLVSPEEDYRIGPNDVIDIRVENMPELTQTFRVTAAGTFLMPFIGRVSAAKKTTEELAQLIADGLRGDYLKDPRVSVSVKEFNSRSFFVFGSVRSPGVFQIEGRPSMLELLTLAGGLTETHGANAYILRRIKTPTGKEPEPKVAKTVTGTSADGDRDAASRNPSMSSKRQHQWTAKGRFRSRCTAQAGTLSTYGFGRLLCRRRSERPGLLHA